MLKGKEIGNTGKGRAPYCKNCGTRHAEFGHTYCPTCYREMFFAVTEAARAAATATEEAKSGAV
jgi:uncharacterized Zn finger protein (UPF0148 family)